MVNHPRGIHCTYLSSKKGHAKVVELLLNNTETDVNANVTSSRSYYNGFTALIFAATRGHAEVVELLLNTKTDVNAVTYYYGYTALIWAAKEGHGHVEVVELLLNNNETDVNAIVTSGGAQGFNALIFAAEKGHTDVVQLLLNKTETDVNAVTYEEGYTA